MLTAEVEYARHVLPRNDASFNPTASATAVVYQKHVLVSKSDQITAELKVLLLF